MTFLIFLCGKAHSIIFKKYQAIIFFVPDTIYWWLLWLEQNKMNENRKWVNTWGFFVLQFCVSFSLSTNSLSPFIRTKEGWKGVGQRERGGGRRRIGVCLCDWTWTNFVGVYFLFRELSQLSSGGTHTHSEGDPLKNRRRRQREGESKDRRCGQVQFPPFV